MKNVNKLGERGNNSVSYSYKIEDIKLGSFNPLQGQSEEGDTNRIFEIYNYAKQLYNTHYITNNLDSFNFAPNGSILEFETVGDFCKMKSIDRQQEGNIKVQLKEKGVYIVYVYDHLGGLIFRSIFHDIGGYWIGFIRADELITGRGIVNGFMYINKSNPQPFFVVTADQGNSQPFLSEESLSRIFMLNFELFPVASLSYRNQFMVYGSLFVYLTNTNNLFGETIFITEPSEEKVQIDSNCLFSDIKRKFPLTGIRVGDVMYNIDYTKSSYPCWLYGSELEYLFRNITPKPRGFNYDR